MGQLWRDEGELLQSWAAVSVRTREKADLSVFELDTVVGLSAAEPLGFSQWLSHLKGWRGTVPERENIGARWRIVDVRACCYRASSSWTDC